MDEDMELESLEGGTAENVDELDIDAELENELMNSEMGSSVKNDSARESKRSESSVDDCQKSKWKKIGSQPDEDQYEDNKENDHKDKNDRKHSDSEEDDDKEDDGLDSLREAALGSLGKFKPSSKTSNGKEKKNDNFGTKSASEEGVDDLEFMRRQLLSKRTKAKPDDLRSKLTSRKAPFRGERVHINPAKQPTAFPNLSFTFPSADGQLKHQQQISPKSSTKHLANVKITRTVRNDSAKTKSPVKNDPNEMIINPNTSSEEDNSEIEVDFTTIHKRKHAKKRRNSSRSVFQTANDIVADDENSCANTDSGNLTKLQYLLFMKDEEIRQGKRKSKMRSDIIGKQRHREERSRERRRRSSNESRECHDSPRRSRDRRRHRSREHSSKKSKEDLESKMERIRRENQRLEEKAKLVEYERKKYSKRQK